MRITVKSHAKTIVVIEQVTDSHSQEPKNQSHGVTAMSHVRTIVVTEPVTWSHADKGCPAYNLTIVLILHTVGWYSFTQH